MLINLLNMASLENIVKRFNDLSIRLDEVLDKGKLCDDYKGLLKSLYDYTQREGFSGSSSLPELIVEDFDIEQLWQELELQNESYLSNVIGQVAKLLVSKGVKVIPVKMDLNDVNAAKRGLKRARPLLEEDRAVSSDEEPEMSSCARRSQVNDGEIPSTSKSKYVAKDPPSSEADDRFFRLSAMESFLNEERTDENTEVFDLFASLESDSDLSQPMYDDFFDQPDDTVYLPFPVHPDTSDDEDYFRPRPNRPQGNISQEEESGAHSADDTELSSPEPSQSLDGNQGSGGEEGVESAYGSEVDEGRRLVEEAESPIRVPIRTRAEEENESDEDYDIEQIRKLNADASDNSEAPTDFQRRQQKLQAKILKLEQEAVGQKPWPMSGEVSGGDRPANSLLEEFVEFDTTQRPAPVITEAVTDRLEDIIRSRIRDQAFDDVERKIKPVALPAEFKKRLVLDQEKSKLSLAEIYENEYLKQKQESNSVEKEKKVPAEHIDIAKRLASLFRKLDSLSDMYFTPRYREPELKLVGNTPVASIEDVGPTVNSDVTMLAPEEAAAEFKRDLKGKDERSRADKKRERRKKKRLQSRRFKAQAAAAAGKGERTYAEELCRATKFRNVTTLEERIGNSTKTSKDFFGKLQELQSSNHQPKKAVRRKASANEHSAKKLKL